MNKAYLSRKKVRHACFVFSFGVGRGCKIRTCDPLVPNQVRYQTAPSPDWPLIKSIVGAFQVKGLSRLAQSKNRTGAKNQLTHGDVFTLTDPRKSVDKRRFAGRMGDAGRALQPVTRLGALQIFRI